MAFDRSRFKAWYGELTLEPLDPCAPGEQRYVALADSGRGAVDEMYSVIDLSIDPTSQLLSGPSGSGKTTELRRLKGRLEEAGFVVVMVDILDYVSQSSEIDIVEVLIAVALAMEEQLAPGEQPGETGGWKRRFQQFLTGVNVSVGVGAVAGTASSEGVTVQAPGLSVDIDLKREMKASQRFVDELRAQLGFHLGDLRSEVAEHCAELVRAHVGTTSGVVMIVDSLEKIRGTTVNDERVQESVARVLVHHGEKLRFDSHHMVFTVPPYLLFTQSGSLRYDGGVRSVPIPHVEDRDRAPVEENVAQLVEVVGRRIPWLELLDNEQALHEVIRASGGHLRDLFRILQELVMILNARAAPLPATGEQVAEAIDKVAFDFSSITAEDARFLREVHAERGPMEPQEGDIGRFARLLQAQMVLAHRNGGGLWYEVHPLARRALRLE